MYSKLKKRYLGLGSNIRVCFFTALVCGLLAHAYVLTHHLYNYDELWHTPAGFGTGVQIGRWGLSILAVIIKKIFGDVYTIPVINGSITILLHAMTACLVVDTLDIKDEIFAGITGALLLTFPGLTCRMFSMFTAHLYAIGLLSAALGVWMLAKCKKNVIYVALAIALLVFGTGVYQTNFAFAVCMSVGYLLCKYIKKDEEVAKTIKDCASYVAYLGVSMAGYFIVHKASLAILGIEMAEHGENYDTMGQLSGPMLITAISRCYKNFIRVCFADVYQMNPTIIVKLSFAISLLAYLYVLVRVWSAKRSICNKIIISTIFLILPIAVNIIVVMTISSGVMYCIMVYELVFMFLIAIGCLEGLTCFDVESNGAEDTADRSCNIDNTVRYVGAITFSLSVLVYIWFANGNYLALEYSNQHDYAYYVSLMSNIKETDGYKDELPLVIIGVPGDDSTFNTGSLIGNTFNMALKTETNIDQYSQWNIMTKIVGFNPEVKWSDEDGAYFGSLDEVREMPCYPDDGSIKVIEGTVVVKFQNFE